MLELLARVTSRVLSEILKSKQQTPHNECKVDIHTLQVEAMLFYLSHHYIQNRLLYAAADRRYVDFLWDSLVTEEFYVYML